MDTLNAKVATLQISTDRCTHTSHVRGRRSNYGFIPRFEDSFS
jgi:hypothetical protein